MKYCPDCERKRTYNHKNRKNEDVYPVIYFILLILSFSVLFFSFFGSWYRLDNEIDEYVNDERVENKVFREYSITGYRYGAEDQFPTSLQWSQTELDRTAGVFRVLTILIIVSLLLLVGEAVTFLKYYVYPFYGDTKKELKGRLLILFVICSLLSISAIPLYFAIAFPTALSEDLNGGIIEYGTETLHYSGFYGSDSVTFQSNGDTGTYKFYWHPDIFWYLSLFLVLIQILILRKVIVDRKHIVEKKNIRKF